MTEIKHKIVIDFADSEVRKKSAIGVPGCFRPWESVPPTTTFSPPKWGKYVRRTAAAGYPAFDMFSEWLMDFATISAGQLGRSDWQNFRRMLLLHVPDCDLYCWYCYNDAWEGVKGVILGEVSAKDLIKQFSDYAKRERTDGNQVNILRISGGEPFLRHSKLIEDIATEFVNLKEPVTAFLWVDTNLHPFGKAINQERTAALDALSTLGSRVALHACIHGATSETLSRNSLIKTEPKDIESALLAFIHRKIPIYPRINPAALSPEEVKEIFILLRDFSSDKTFPLKTYLGPIELLYEHSIDRMRMFRGEDPLFVETAKPPPVGCKPSIPRMFAPNAGIFEWNRQLENHYGVGYGKIPRHMTPNLRLLAQHDSKQKSEPERVWEEVILLCKGWEKEVYAEKMLEILSVPNGAHVDVEFENKWIEPGLVAYASACPNFHTTREVKVLVVCCHKARVRGMIPLRWAALKWLSSTNYQSEQHSIILTLEIKDYAVDLTERVPGEEGEGLYEKMARYTGLKHLPFASDTSYFCRLVGFETFIQKPSPMTANNDQSFKSAVIELVRPCYEAAKRDVYFRIKSIKDVASNNDLFLSEGTLNVAEGQKIQLVFEACNPNLGSRGYPEVGHAIVRLATTEPARVSISPEILHLSKYGEPTARVAFEKAGEFSGEILVEPIADNARIPSFRIPFQVKVDE